MLCLHHNRIATLPALDPLLRLRRLRGLTVTGNPVNACTLLRRYVKYRCGPARDPRALLFLCRHAQQERRHPLHLSA
jgi:hypothetical protein